MGYYASWQTGQSPVNRIDFSALTHIMLAHWLTAANGSINSSSWDTSCASVVTPAHAQGVKVIMMLGGSDDGNFASAAAPANQAALIRSIQAKVSACNLDGVDLDWETGINQTNFISLAQNLRAAAPSYVITAPVDPTVQPASLAVGLAAYCDRVSMMTYGNANSSGGWASWYFSALAGDGTNHPASVDKWVTSWVAAGMPAGKIGVGVGFYANGWTPPVTGALQSPSSVPVQEMPYGWPSGSLLSCYYNKAGWSYLYDSSPALNTEPATPPEQPSLSYAGGGGYTAGSGCPGSALSWITFEDEASIAAKAAYVNAHNLGGVIIWLIGEGVTDPNVGRNPLLDVVKLGVLNSGPAPMPLLGSTNVVVGGAANIVVSSLPANLNQVGIIWRGGGTSFDDNIGNYGDYGRPSEYYIEGSPDGTTWTALTHVTGNTYNKRHFVFDITGTGYIQIRMRIVSIVGGNAGNVTLDVHNAANNSADTYLLLGDSITSNCWGAVSGGDTDLFGAGVHAQRPNRYPMAGDGGIPGLLSSSPLSTTPYGIPAIRQWLADNPAVKFVGLSYGTNDANGNIPAATYAANMQAMVKEVIAAGKVPIIPTIVASPSANVQANAPAMNAAIAKLKQNYPSIISGPDLWTLFSGHSVADGWFFDSLHPSLTTGCSALQNAWANTMVGAVYPQ
jgi:chitinase